MIKDLIQEGAEAKVYLRNNKIIKDRISKSYRHKILDDKIRISRTKREGKILKKAFELKISVPKLISSDKFSIELEFINGDKISDKLNAYPKEKQLEVMKNIGHQTSIMHKNHIIHGDLTTSNTLLKEEKVFIIDFGLSFISSKIEDMAVDLHLIKQALEAKHYLNHDELFNAFLKGYKWEKSKEVISRLEIVEKRGRYKH